MRRNKPAPPPPVELTYELMLYVVHAYGLLHKYRRAEHTCEIEAAREVWHEYVAYLGKCQIHWETLEILRAQGDLDVLLTYAFNGEVNPSYRLGY